MTTLRSIIGKIVRSWALWLPPVLFALAYFIVQMTQISQYGVSWDEPLHRNWGKLFALFLQTGERNYLDIMPGHGIDYGPVYFYLNYVISEFFIGSGWLTFVEANHVLTLLVSAVAVGLTYLLGQMIGGKRIGLFAACFMIFFPQFVAHAHYNPKDIPVMVSVLLTATVFLVGLRRNSVPILLLSAFLFGMSTSVKITTLLMGPVFAAVYLTWLLRSKRSSSTMQTLRQQILVIVGALASCTAGLYLFWPSAWGDPLLVPKAMHFFFTANFWPGTVVFFGTEYAGADLPLIYIPFEFAAAMPLLMLIAFVLGMAVVFRRMLGSTEKLPYLLLLLWTLVPLLLSMKPGFVRYDGMRQFFFVLPAIAILSAMGLQQLFVSLTRKARHAYTGVLFLGLVFFSLASQVAALHPFEGSYRSELLQMAYPENLDQSFDIEYWGAVYKQGMDWLTENAEPHPVICVPIADMLVTWYPWRDDFRFECSDDSTYVMFFTRYSQTGDFQIDDEPVFEIRRMKSALLQIYKVK